jgi:prepilin-type N-terminal cleavage/methylation domain-containing protein
MPWFLDRRAAARDAGFTLVEVLVASGVLSVLVLCTVHLWAVCGRMAGDLLLRQKAVFVLDGEMERLAALYATTAFGALTLPQPTLDTSLNNIPNSAVRSTYPVGNPLTPFVTAAAGTFASADTYVWAPGLGAAARDYVWLDRGRAAMARISWIACPISATTLPDCWGGTAGKGKVPNGAYNCYPASGLAVAGTCQLLTLVLDYPYWLQNGAAVAGPTVTTLTLNTVVGRRR